MEIVCGDEVIYERVGIRTSCVKNGIFLINGKPVKLCGVLSEGMILCAEDEAGNLSLLTPERAVESGANIR